MNGVRVHRSQARRNTAMAQAATAALLAGAVAAYALLPVADEATAPQVVNGPTGEDAGGNEPPMDFVAVADMLGPWDAPIKNDPEEVPDDSGPADVAQGEAAPAWKYLGAIAEAQRLVAIVEIDGTQRLMAPGSIYRGQDGREVTIVEVNRAEMIVADAGGAQRTIVRMKRDGAVIGSSGSIAWEAGEGGENNEDAMPGFDARMNERRTPPGARRPTVPGSKGVPRPNRPTAAPPRSGAASGT